MLKIQLLLRSVIVCCVFVMAGQSRASHLAFGVGIVKVELVLVAEVDIVVVTVWIIANVDFEVSDPVLFVSGSAMAEPPLVVELIGAGLAAEEDMIVVFCGAAE